MSFSKWVFGIAAVYGVLVLVPHYFMESMIGSTQPPAITHPEFFYGFVGAALACQIMFWIISTDTRKYRPLMIAAIFEKFSFVGALIALGFTRGLHPALYAPGLIDLVLGLLFIVAFVRSRSPAR